jgi:hypothetical protein
VADLVVKQHDTFPALRGLAKDQEGPMDLLSADKLKVILKAQTGAPPTVVEGEAEALNPEDDEEGMNWEYPWAIGDTAEPGVFDIELEITWDEHATPPTVQTVPNGSYSTVEFKADLA